MASTAPHAEAPLVKTKIIATVGPACAERDQLEQLVVAGVDLFRLNFAHGSHDWMAAVLARIRDIEQSLDRPIGVHTDLAGPKIRLGEIDGDSLLCQKGETVSFVRGSPAATGELTCTYEPLSNDVHPGDRILLADGLVSLRVESIADDGTRIDCRVEQPGTVRSRQGVNLPGVKLSTPSLTDKDRLDLAWALANRIDYVGLSFVRTANDIRLLRQAIDEDEADHSPHIVAKIEKQEAVDDLDAILDETDGLMVARGDLGVELDLAKVPVLQKQIIRLANQHRVPVITATQMLDSMTTSELPTRAEATDVANAVLDGTDAVMLSGETAIGVNPLAPVVMMSRIIRETEQLVDANAPRQFEPDPRARALDVTEAVCVGAVSVAEQLEASVLVVPTLSGRTALAVSKERSPVPIVALSNRIEIARRMNLYWGVRTLYSPATVTGPRQLLDAITAWGRGEGFLEPGSRIVLVGSSNWSDEGHDLILVHAVL